MDACTPVIQTTGTSDITQRIYALADHGLKVRDISSLLHIHPLIVAQAIAERLDNCANQLDRQSA